MFDQEKEFVKSDPVLKDIECFTGTVYTALRNGIPQYIRPNLFLSTSINTPGAWLQICFVLSVEHFYDV